MSQWVPYGDGNDKQRRLYYVYNGVDYIPVKARIIEPYSTPSPSLDLKELKVIDAPSHLHQMGSSSYKVTLSLLFNTKKDLSEYLFYVTSIHKYIDERGNIFQGGVEGSPKITPYEGLTRFKVEVSLTLNKKDGWETERKLFYQDLDGIYQREDILEMASLGLIASRSYSGDEVLYFGPLEYLSRAEAATVANNLRKRLQNIIRK